MKFRGFAVFLLLAGSALAQLDAGSVIHRMQVHVSFTNGVCDRSAQVTLMGRSGPVDEAVPNDRCEVEFSNVPIGTYHLNVSGQNFTSTDDVIMASSASSEFDVRVKRSTDVTPLAGAPASVSVAELGIPTSAQKEFDKANQLIARQDFTKAIQTLDHAIALYPAYAGAYNNLAVIYARTGDGEKEVEALQKAISINDHFAPAYVNLARVDLGNKDFAGAEAALSKATSYDPTDAMTLVLLTYSQFMDHHYDLAIATSHRAHALDGNHAFAHQVAAHAYEQKRDGVNAIAELETFLKEEPTGQRAENARKELAQLQEIVRRPAQAQ